jgi:thymidylate synthase
MVPRLVLVSEYFLFAVYRQSIQVHSGYLARCLDYKEIVLLKYEKEYNALCSRVLNEGHSIYNERTGKTCITLINHDFVYDVGKGEIPLLTNKQCFTVGAVAEVLGYYRQYTNAQQFEDIGSKTWWANSNNPQWTNSPHYKGLGDLGKIYGSVTGNTLADIVEMLTNKQDNRRLIYQMWVKDSLGEGCLAPCAYEHIWSLVGDKLSLTVTQRSGDLPLGIPYNSFSFCFLLKLMAKITGNVPDKVFHKIVNVHVYSDQVNPLIEQLSREPLDINPEMNIAGWVTTLDDVIGNDKHAKEYFTLTGYEHQGKITFPFSA